ncbi:MAG: hypothetical protein IID31_00925 [Planctomycetes bacterium]|nr:hypothetical protein [Planctomycetota bacterium]
MFEHVNRTIAPTLALVLAAAAFQTARAVPLGLAGPEDPIQPAAVDGQSNEQALLRVHQLLSEGRCVRARALAISLIGDASRRLTEPQDIEAHELIVSADDRIKRMDPLDVSVRLADIALETGDMATALRHAQAVTAHASATAEQASDAERILGRIDAGRRELAPLVPATIAQVHRDFENRRYAEAKSGLDAIHRSAIVLTDEQSDVVAMYRSMIVSREEVRGEPFAFTTVSLGMLQPDVVTRRSEPEGQPEEEAQPEPPPAPELEELPDAQPEVEAQPEQAPPPQPEPLVGDLIQVAMTAEAMGILGEANRAFERNEWVTAQTKYRQLQDEFLSYLTDEQRGLISNRLAQAAIELNQPAPGEIGPAIDRAEAVRSQTRAEFDHLMNRANAALRTGDISSARAAQAEARLIINGRRQYFNEDQYNAFDRQVEQLRSRLDAAENQLAQAERRRQIDALEGDAADTKKRIAEVRRHKIDEYIDRARSYQAEGQYEEALQTIERLLFLDPNNPSGLLLRDVYRDILIFTRAMQIQTEKRYKYATMHLDNSDAAIPPPGIVNYPDQWRMISLKRGEPSSFQDSPENAAIYADLRTQRIASIALTDNTLEEVVEYIETVTSHNVDVDWGELATVSIQPETTVSLSLNNVTIETLLDRVLDKVSLDDLSRAAWEVRDGIITISSDQAIRKHTHLHIYDIRDMLLDTPNYEEVPEIDLQQAMQQSSGRGGGGSSQSPFNQDQDDDDTDRRTLEDRTLEIIDIITTNVDFEGWVENGGETGNIQNWNGNLIITNTVSNHAQIHGLLQQLRAVRAMQINVETRFLLINQDFFEQIGFDLDVYWNANNNQFRAAVANDPTLLPSDFFDFGGATNPGRSLTGAQAPLAPTTAPANTEITQGVINPRSFSIIGMPQNSLGLAEALIPAAGIASSVLSGAPALGIAGQFVDDIQVDFLVKATQADRRSVALTAPRLTFMNGQIANIFVATQQAYISDLQPVVADSAVGFDPTVAVVTEGVTMLIEGVISSDRRYVTMNVDVGISRIDGFATQPVTAVAGGQLVNSADTASFIQLPQVTVTRVRTSVTVPDQGTVLLGGQRLTTEFEVETGVPVLSKIPILNRFFSNRIKSRDEQTLLILIRPTVLIQSELEESFEPGLNSLLRSGFGG